jgi:hypothetical protein
VSGVTGMIITLIINKKEVIMQENHMNYLVEQSADCGIITYLRKNIKYYYCSRTIDAQSVKKKKN